MKRIQIGDTVRVQILSEDLKLQVMSITPHKPDTWYKIFHGVPEPEGDTLIGLEEDGHIGTHYVTEVSLDYDPDTNEWFTITEEEARRRGLIVITSR